MGRKMGDKLHLYNSMEVSRSALGKARPGANKSQEQAYYANQQEASVFYGAECHFDMIELHHVLREILYGQDEHEKKSYFSEYSVNFDELSDSSATSPCES